MRAFNGKAKPAARTAPDRWKAAGAIAMLLAMIRAILAGAAAACVACGAAAQANLTPIDAFKDWSAYTVKEKDGKACYIASQPKDSKPKDAKRDPIWLLVTHRPYRKIENEVSIYSGYPYKDGSITRVEVDGQPFELFTANDTAWSNTPADDEKLVDAMRKGNMLHVKGVSARGTETMDQYSLAGFSAAMKAIGDACGVK
jgi:invasion protein IalB